MLTAQTVALPRANRWWPCGLYLYTHRLISPQGEAGPQGDQGREGPVGVPGDPVRDPVMPKQAKSITWVFRRKGFQSLGMAGERAVLLQTCVAADTVSMLGSWFGWL